MLLRSERYPTLKFFMCSGWWWKVIYLESDFRFGRGDDVTTFTSNSRTSSFSIQASSYNFETVLSYNNQRDVTSYFCYFRDRYLTAQFTLKEISFSIKCIAQGHEEAQIMKITYLAVQFNANISREKTRRHIRVWGSHFT